MNERLNNIEAFSIKDMILIIINGKLIITKDNKTKEVKND